MTTESAWFAARPSGTEDVYKIYAESFQGPDHLAEVQAEAREVVSAALRLVEVRCPGRPGRRRGSYGGRVAVRETHELAPSARRRRRALSR